MSDEETPSPRQEDSKDHLDELFGSSSEDENAMEVDKTEEPVQDQVMESAVDSEAERQNEISKALFGDDDTEETELSSEEDVSPAKKRKARNVLSRKDITLDHCTNLETAGLKPYSLKLPGFIAVEEEEYSRARLLTEELGFIETDPNGNYPKDGLLRLSTSIRWRQNPMTEEIETNARIIKWSDGSMSLSIGHEQFELMNQNTQKENNYLFTRHPKDGCMEAVGKLEERLAVRPFITADQSHRKFLAISTSTVQSAGHASGREAAKVKMAVTTADPEREKQRMVKLEQEKIKSKRKVEARRRNIQSRSYERVARTGLSAKFLEEDERDGGDEEGEDEDRYEDDFIDDTENVVASDDEESEEDTDYKSGDDNEAEEDGSDGSDASEGESTAQESGAESDESYKSDKKSKSKKPKKQSPSKKSAKIIESDDE